MKTSRKLVSKHSSRLGILIFSSVTVSLTPPPLTVPGQVLDPLQFGANSSFYIASAHFSADIITHDMAFVREIDTFFLSVGFDFQINANSIVCFVLGGVI